MSHVFRQKYFSCVCVLCIEIENTVFSMFCNPTEWRMVEFNRNLILRSVGWQKCSAGGLWEVMSIFMFMLNYDLIIKSTHLFRWFWVIHSIVIREMRHLQVLRVGAARVRDHSWRAENHSPEEALPLLRQGRRGRQCRGLSEGGCSKTLLRCQEVLKP